MSKRVAPAPKEEKPKKVSVFEDEDAFAADIERRATEAAEKRIQSQHAEAMKRQAVAQSIYAEFPEVADESHALMVRAKEVFSAMSDEERNSPLAMKIAVTQAAAENGIKPKSKRSADDDSFTIGGGSKPGPRSNNKADIDEATELFGRLAGLNMDDPAVRERMKKGHGRRSYTRWE